MPEFIGCLYILLVFGFVHIHLSVNDNGDAIRDILLRRIEYERGVLDSNLVDISSYECATSD